MVADLSRGGHRVFLAGGAVRDALLDNTCPPKDLDFEVYGITYPELAEKLSAYGRVDLVGKSFGVVKLTVEGEIHDFSLPRRDSKTGAHHRDFEIQFDPAIDPREAAARRDFTINAMSWDPLTGELLDFFDGQSDLASGILRATSDAFAEDPLRVLRGMQFACRFNLTLDPGTARKARSIAGQYSTLATERVAEEFMKWATKSSHPGLIGEYLRDTDWLIHFPEIANLYGTPQDPQWHPEGDVGVHTMFVLDEAARVAARDGLTGDERAELVFAALTHDFAKPATTELREKDGAMRWTSWGHEPAGGPMARTFLERIGIKPSIRETVAKLVEHHLVHHSIAPPGQAITSRAVRRLAVRLAPASIEQLVRLIEADASGRPPLAKGIPNGAQALLTAAQHEAVSTRPQPALILGRHVLPYFGNKPGKQIGEITRAAFEAQTDGAFSTEEEALGWLHQYVKSHVRN